MWHNYDAWGNRVGGAWVVHDQDIYKNLFYANPFRYRGYYQDSETGFYYCGNRYYDPAIGRFINADSTNTLMNTPMAYTDKNLYAYCDNNPVMRVDNGGEFWDTVFDVVSLCFSVVDVIKNPDDPWAWVGLAADVVSLAVPFATGGGTVVKAVSKADDVVDLAKNADRAIDAIDTVSDIGKAAGKVDDVSDTIKAAQNIGNSVDSLDELRKNQRALSDLGKEIERNAKKGNFISFDEAKIFDEWCKEYGIPQHHPALRDSGKHWVTGWDHTHFYRRHIPFK